MVSSCSASVVSVSEASGNNSQSTGDFTLLYSPVSDVGNTEEVNTSETVYGGRKRLRRPDNWSKKREETRP